MKGKAFTTKDTKDTKEVKNYGQDDQDKTANADGVRVSAREL